MKLVNPSGVLPYDSLWRESRFETGDSTSLVEDSENFDDDVDSEGGEQDESDAAAAVSSVRSRTYSFGRSRSRCESTAGGAAQSPLSGAQLRSLLHVQSPAFDCVPSQLVTLFVSNQCV